MKIFLEIEVDEADIPGHVNVDRVPEGVRKQVERILNEWQRSVDFTVSLSQDPGEAYNEGYDAGTATCAAQYGE